MVSVATGQVNHWTRVRVKPCFISYLCSQRINFKCHCQLLNANWPLALWHEHSKFNVCMRICRLGLPKNFYNHWPVETKQSFLICGQDLPVKSWGTLANRRKVVQFKLKGVHICWSRPFDFSVTNLVSFVVLNFEPPSFSQKFSAQVPPVTSQSAPSTRRNERSTSLLGSLTMHACTGGLHNN